MKVAVLITGQLRDYKVNALNQIKHLIEPNDADVFVYACNKNTLHVAGQAMRQQKYHITTENTREEIIKDVKNTYGKNLKQVLVNENEDLDEGSFGTFGYFRRRMQNQMDNIRKGFLMAMKHSRDNNFEYDVIVRSRPDNSIYPKVINLSEFPIEDGLVHSTVFYTGHRDPWFFSFANPKTFNTYCALKYYGEEEDSRTDNNFDCPELAMEKYLASSAIRLSHHTDIGLTFTGLDRTEKINDFPHREIHEKLISSTGALVEQRL